MQLFLNSSVEWHTVKNLIRLLLQEQSDLGLHYLHMPFCQKLWSTKFQDIYLNPYDAMPTSNFQSIKLLDLGF